jgi:hypothetical protein
MPWNNPNHYLIRHIAISSPARGPAAQPLDLGVLTLETR